MSKASGKPRIGIFHSELVKLGPVKITVDSDVMESEFNGKPDFVYILIDGEKRRYDAENEDCAEFFRGKKGETFTIIAEGGGKGKSDSATITFVGRSGEPSDNDGDNVNDRRDRRRSDRPAARGHDRKQRDEPTDDRRRDPEPERRQERQRTDPPRGHQKTPEDRAKEQAEHVILTKMHAMKVGNAWMIAFGAGLVVRDEIKEQLGEDLTDAQFQAMISTICVQLEKDGFHHGLPTKPVQFRKPEAEKGEKK